MSHLWMLMTLLASLKRFGPYFPRQFLYSIRLIAAQTDFCSIFHHNLVPTAKPRLYPPNEL